MSATASTEREGGGRTTERLRPDAAGIARAAALLGRGGLVAFPTETVYGLGCDASDPAAVAALYAAKGRPSLNPLIAHVLDVGEARREGVLDGAAERLAEAFWPGPLTLVAPVAAGGRVQLLARAGLDTVALRAPSHPAARQILAAFGRPVVAPSANRSGHVSPTAAAHVAADLDGRVDAILDGGETTIGLESTVVACLAGATRLLRPGGVTRDHIEAVLGRPLDGAGDDSPGPIAPGALASHYAPRARLRLNVDGVANAGEAVLGFAGVPRTEGRGLALDLSPSGDLAEAAANLFGYLRRLDATGAPSIAVAPIPRHGLGEAILDRLRRAAAGR